MNINERMIELVRKLATYDGEYQRTTVTSEARAIVAELDGPKTDEEWAFAIEAEVTGEKVWNEPIDMQREIALRGIVKGRELAELDRRTEKAVAPNKPFATGGYVKPAEGTRIQNTEPVRDITDKWDEIGLGDAALSGAPCDHNWQPVYRFGKKLPVYHVCSICGAMKDG